MTFGGPKDGRPNPATPGENSNYNTRLSNLRDRLKHTDNKKRRNRLQNRIQGVKVERWGDRVKRQQNAPPPKDSIYNSDVAAANRDYAGSMVGAALKETSTLRDFGLEKEYQDPNSLQYNPNSRAMALQNAWQRDQRVTNNSYAAQGQLYSGARASDEAYYNRAYLSGVDKEETLYKEALAEIAGSRTAAEEARQQALDEAMQEFGQRWKDARPTEAAPPPKFVKDFKGDLKDKLESLRGKKADAKNKYMKKKLKKKIKATKKDLKSIPQQYAE